MAATRFPKIQIDSDALFIKQGRISTAAGVTAAIDLALAVARDLVVYEKRAGGQQQYSKPLQFHGVAWATGRED